MHSLILEYGSEFDIDSNNDYIYPGINRDLFKEAEFFRSGRDALKAIAVMYKSFCNRVLLPALCCASMVAPFRKNGYEISYFRLNPDLSANITDILSKIESNGIFLYMNYFGIQSLNDETLNFLRKNFPNLIILEDKTHDILSPKCNNKFVPDFTIYSIRKWLAIPDGGVLYSKAQQVNFAKCEDSFFSTLREIALTNKAEYLRSGNPQIKELFRSQLDKANDYLENDQKVVGMSIKSYETLKNIDFYKISKVRRENLYVLSKGFKNIRNVKQFNLFCFNRISPYYPILVTDRNEMQKSLAHNGIYCPIIWPLPKDAEGICEVSDYIANNMLAFPCDHRYRISDMKRMLDIIGNIRRIA